jgi:hypothetical protein
VACCIGVSTDLMKFQICCSLEDIQQTCRCTCSGVHQVLAGLQATGAGVLKHDLVWFLTADGCRH